MTRREKLERIQEEVESGRMIVRQMTPEERERGIVRVSGQEQFPRRRTDAEIIAYVKERF